MRVICRSLVKDDIPFLYGSWEKSFRGYRKHCPDHIYFPHQHKLIEKILQKSNIIIAVSEADQSIIYGYIVWRSISSVPCIEYIYIKKQYRGKGIASTLVDSIICGYDGEIFYTHESIYAQRQKKYKLIYNPYILLEE